MKVIGIDIGTTSVSGVVMDFASGEQIAARTIPNNAHVEGESWADEQDPVRLYEICCGIIDEFMLQWKDIEAIGLTGQMHGILYIDREGNPLSNLITWEDGRGNLIYQDGKSYAAYLSEKTGYPMSTGYGLTTHFYNQVNDLVPENACKICTIMDYAAMKLCELGQPQTHASNAASLGMFDRKHHCFDRSALMAVGMDPKILPQVFDTEDTLGMTKYGCPVMIPIGDNQAGILGVVEEETDVVLNIGTSSQISMICDTLQEPDDLDCRPYVNGKYILLGAGLCGGSSIGLLNDFFCETVRAFFGEVTKDQMFDLMMAEAEREREEDDQLKVCTLFRGKRSEPYLHGSIENIDMTNFTPGRLVLGFYRGVLEEMLEAYRRMPVHPESGKLILTGNALRKNELLRRIAQEMFGREVSVSSQKEEAAVGAAKLAGEVTERVQEIPAEKRNSKKLSQSNE